MDYQDYDYVIVCKECEPKARAEWADAPEDYIVVCTLKERCEFKKHEKKRGGKMMKHWRIEVRRDTVYYVDADTVEEATQAAETEEFSQITEYETDWVKTLEAWEVDEEGSSIEQQDDEE